MAIQAGLIGEKYGSRPCDVLGVEYLHPIDKFWLDAAVRQATVEFEKEVRDDEYGSYDSSGVASSREKKTLHQNKEQRADVRESMEQAGRSAPSVEGQLEALNKKQNKQPT